MDNTFRRRRNPVAVRARWTLPSNASLRSRYHCGVQARAPRRVSSNS